MQRPQHSIEWRQGKNLTWIYQIRVFDLTFVCPVNDSEFESAAIGFSRDAPKAVSGLNHDEGPRLKVRQWDRSGKLSARLLARNLFSFAPRAH